MPVFRSLTTMTGVSAGSKAAMTAITEALRLELAPFGITVATVNTGAVRTNNFANGVNFELPSTSLYKSIEKQIAARARGEDGTPRMEPSVYAEKVVGDILGGASGQIWRGGYASLVRFVLSKLPVWVSVSRLRSWCSGINALTLRPGLDVHTEYWVRRYEDQTSQRLTVEALCYGVNSNWGELSMLCSVFQSMPGRPAMET